MLRHKYLNLEQIWQTLNMTFDKSYYASYLKSEKPEAWSEAKSKRQFNYDAIAKKISFYCPNVSRIIEVGCGLGFLTDTIARLPWSPEIHAGDISEYAVEQVAENVRLANVNCRVLNAEALDFSDGFADLVLAFDVIEHLSNPELFIAECRRVLKPNGVLFFSTPNPGSFGSRVKKGGIHSTSEAGSNRVWSWFANKDETHINIRSISEWRKLLIRFNFLRISDGSDYLWDTPYFHLPILPQKIIFNGSHRLITRLSLFSPWVYGENYYGIWQVSAIRQT
jgi:2-polyprenyl-3-methyl-5-hydroxy-6-metoxy-1,4-benzoquinol methylase